MLNVPAGMRINFMPIELVNSFSAAIDIEETTIAITIINTVVMYLMPSPFPDSDFTFLQPLFVTVNR